MRRMAKGSIDRPGQEPGNASVKPVMERSEPGGGTSVAG